MSGRRYPRVVQNADGWSDWIHPTMRRYQMGCCDCGLVHTLQFRVELVTKRNRNGSFQTAPVRGEQFRVAFRAGRNNRATANMRRAKR